MKLTSRKTDAVVLCVLLLLGVPALLYGNLHVQTEELSLSSPKLPAGTSLSVAQVSDFHNNHSRLVQKQVIDALAKAKPDLIFLTGDMVDCRRTDVEETLGFCKELSSLAPTYFVDGNHEVNLGVNSESYVSLHTGLTQCGVTILSKEQRTVEIRGVKVVVCGLQDPFYRAADTEALAEVTKEDCEAFALPEGTLSLLLAHQPELIDTYARFGFDAVFSGHAHGGQVRLFGRGLYAPGQGLLPQYTDGSYLVADTTLFVSRGLGNSIAPVRAFDHLHLLLCTFSSTA